MTGLLENPKAVANHIIPNLHAIMEIVEGNLFRPLPSKKTFEDDDGAEVEN